MKNSISKVIHFMRTVVNESPNHRYNMIQDKDGRAVFVDKLLRIEVRVGVDHILINQFAASDSGELINTASIDWEELSMRQKADIIEIVDDAGDGEPDERDEIIERIFCNDD